jgi:predicted enzyme related to lactoylglutathione lyase
MARVDRHAPGEFCWLELGTTDQNAAKEYYGRLFGWEAADFPMGPAGVYTIFRLDGAAAAATYTLMEDQKAAGVPPHWLLYVSVQSADMAAARAKELGGAVLGGPFDVGENGRMAIIRDPQGAVFAVWQPKQNPGIGIAGVPGTLCWADLMTPDPSGAQGFYSALFGWELAIGQNDSSGYLHIKNGEAFIGGVPPAHQRNPNAPPHWLAYILVTDCDATAKLAEDMGGRLYVPPMSIENVGRMAVVADPQGAVFAIFTPAARG